MNKEKFLESLRKKLSILEESEIEENIEEYSSFIDEKVSQGSTEEEAVKALGNPSELAKEILSAYKIKSEETENKESYINKLIDEMIAIFETVIDEFSKKDFKEILRFILEIVCILIVIGFCRIPFEIIKSFGSSFISSLSHEIGFTSGFVVISKLGSFILELFYVLFATILFVKIFKQRYITEDITDKMKSTKISKEDKPVKEVKVTKKSNEKPKEEVVLHNSDFSIIDFLMKLFIIFAKVIAFCFLIGVIFYIVGLATCVGLSIYLLVKGVFYLGIYFIILSLFTLGILVFILLFDFIFDRKAKFTAMLITCLSSFIVLGIGIALTTVEVANTTILYDYEDYNNRAELVLDYKDNLVIDGYFDEIKTDESLDNIIKVVYEYNDRYFKINPEYHTSKYKTYEVVDLITNINQFKYSKEVFENVLDDLKDKTIKAHDYDIKVTLYGNSKVLEQLQKNEDNYSSYNRYYDDYDMDDICEELYERGYSLPSYCKYYDYDEF